MFVRHTLPGERVRVVVTDGAEASSFWRADAVEVLDAVAGPGRRRPARGPARAAAAAATGSTSSVPAQRALKADGRARAAVPPGAASTSTWRSSRCPGDADGLGWRTRVTWAVADDGPAGLRRHRSHEVVPVDSCRIAHPLVDEAGVTRRTWPGVGSVEVSASVATGDRLVLPDGRGDGVLTEVVGEPRLPGHRRRLLAGPPRRGRDLAGRGPGRAASRSRGTRRWTCTAGSACSPPRLAERRRAHRPGHPGRVGPGRRGGRPAQPGRARRRCGSSAAGSTTCCAGCAPARADLVVLDPPRSGAGQARWSTCVARGAAAADRLRRLRPGRAGPRPTWFAERGYRLTGLRAFDIFPMTHHVECVALLEPAADLI